MLLPPDFDPKNITIETLSLAEESAFIHQNNYPIIDVRSEGEYAQGHIPNAINIPIFTNAERAIIGTLYKQQGNERAVAKGLEMVKPKLANFISQAQEIAKNKDVIVHCWRGGMRSKSFAWWLTQNGFRTRTIIGGYKAYRNWVLERLTLTDYTLTVIGGNTGSGKTDLLHILRDADEQIIDLEAIAHHRGSSFGALGMLPQPSVEQFENTLCSEFLRLDPTRRVWIEAESRRVGSCILPIGLWERMVGSWRINVHIPTEARVARLVAEYGKYTPAELIAAVTRIQKRMGLEQTRKAIEHIENGDLAACVRICLRYYDKNYEDDRDKWAKNRSLDIETTSFDAAFLQKLCAF